MRNVFFVLAGLLFGIVPAFAEPPSCRGDDPLAALRQDKPEAYAAFEAEMATVPNAEGLLWRIEKDGRSPSHLFGTVHLTDERVTELPDVVVEALGGSDIAAFELAAIGNPREQAKLAARILVRAMNIGGKPTLPNLSAGERAHRQGACRAWAGPGRDKQREAVVPCHIPLLHRLRDPTDSGEAPHGG